jgi:hypothetical protein
MRHIKLFEDFLSNLHNSEMTIKNYATQVEKILQVKLKAQYDSREDGHEPEEEDDGHFISFEFGEDMRAVAKFGLSDSAIPDISSLEDIVPIINIYENGKFQLFFDATPYPVSAHSPSQARQMMMSMNPFPLSIDNLKKEDVFNWLNNLVEEYGE